jgi:hypothetical protein
MNHTTYPRPIALASTLAALLLGGCASVSNETFNAIFTDYGGQAKVHLKVGINVTDELRQAKNDKWKLPIGEAIAANAPELARHLFDQVVELSNSQLPPDTTVAAILTPKVVYTARTVGATPGADAIVDLKVEWTLSDAKGNPIWVDTVDGQSSDSTHTNPKKVARKALEDLLRKSQQAIASALAVKRFAQKQLP